MGTKRGEQSKSLYQRFIEKTVRVGDCLIWIGPVQNGGYGVLGVYLNGRNTQKRATHVAWFLETLFWPEGWMLHKNECHNRACVEVTHLYEGTALENNRDIHERTRQLQEEVNYLRRMLYLYTGD